MTKNEQNRAGVLLLLKMIKVRKNDHF